MEYCLQNCIPWAGPLGWCDTKGSCFQMGIWDFTPTPPSRDFAKVFSFLRPVSKYLFICELVRCDPCRFGTSSALFLIQGIRTRGKCHQILLSWVEWVSQSFKCLQPPDVFLKPFLGIDFIVSLWLVIPGYGTPHQLESSPNSGTRFFLFVFLLTTSPLPLFPSLPQMTVHHKHSINAC